jgi:hypothetical protein
MNMPTAAARFATTAFLLWLCVGTGCERSPSSPASAAGAAEVGTSSPHGAEENLSPLQTVRRVHELRLAGELVLLERYLVPEQRRAIIELIQSVDQLVLANHVLREAVTEHLGAATAQRFDRPQVANIIGVFSHDVEILGERIEGDEAVVTIQVARRLPLSQVELMRTATGWRIQTDPPIEGVAGEIRRLAQTMTDAARRVRLKKLTSDGLQHILAVRWAQVERRIKTLTRPDNSEG